MYIKKSFACACGEPDCEKQIEFLVSSDKVGIYYLEKDGTTIASAVLPINRMKALCEEMKG